MIDNLPGAHPWGPDAANKVAEFQREFNKAHAKEFDLADRLKEAAEELLVLSEHLNSGRLEFK